MKIKEMICRSKYFDASFQINVSSLGITVETVVRFFESNPPGGRKVSRSRVGADFGARAQIFHEDSGCLRPVTAWGTSQPDMSCCSIKNFNSGAAAQAFINDVAKRLVVLDDLYDRWIDEAAALEVPNV